VDTGGWYAVASADDRHHAAGTRYFRELVEASAQLITSDHVLDETLTRLRYDGRPGTARAFWQRLEQAQQGGFLNIVRLDEAAWDAALGIFFQYEDQAFSFTDCTSFVLAQSHGVDEVFTFDAHFLMFGLVVKPIPES
jgi:predicted nucleic acid-binding protein